MAQHLDLEEQEQLAELKHFWSKYGNLITWALILFFGTIAAYNGWNWWQRHQATEASAMFDEIERAAGANDLAKVQRASADLRDQYGRTTYAEQGALLAARSLADGGKTDEAKAALQWVVDKASDKGYQAIGRLRLAAVLADGKAYDDALKQLSGDFPREFTALASDRRGDIFSLQGKKTEARAQYVEALKTMDASADYRRLIEVKLAALGGDPAAVPAAPAAPAAKEASKS